MDRVIMIKYGELSTKKANRNFFINTLYHNVLDKLNGLDVNVYKDRARMYIEFLDNDLDEILNRISKVFGIHEYDVAFICKSDIDSIKKCVLDACSNMNFKTFKSIVKRSDKNFPIHSSEMNNIIGGLLLKNIPNISVDVHNPDLFVNVEIREDNTLIYFNKYKGAGGYPVGTQKGALLMLSGGIDSPVAGYLALKRGVMLDAVYFEAVPHTSLEAREKVINLSRKLLEYTSKINLHVVNFTKIQEEIYKNCKDDYVITIMRRMMYRIMEKLCVKYDAKAIVNGESIGQVASQTLDSMMCINSVTNYPVIRPVACLDKLEIIDISKKIDTYDISILPYEDCCTVFVPKHPVINPKLDTCVFEENKFDYNGLINEAVDNVNTIKIVKNEDYSSLL